MLETVFGQVKKGGIMGVVDVIMKMKGKKVDMVKYLDGIIENTAQESDRALGFHASGLSYKEYCLRELYLGRLYKVEGDPLDIRTMKIFSIGHLFHNWIQNRIKEGGVLVREEVPFFDEETEIRGRADAIIKVPSMGNVLLEFKTINARSFFKLQKSYDPHQVQITLYHRFLKERYNLADIGYIVYIEKQTGMMKAFECDYSVDIEDIIKETKEVKERLWKREIPDRICRNEAEAGSCPFKNICFGKEAVEMRSIYVPEVSKAKDIQKIRVVGYIAYVGEKLKVVDKATGEEWGIVEVEDIYKQKLSEMPDEDIELMGYKSFDEWKKIWNKYSVLQYEDDPVSTVLIVKKEG